MIDPVPERIKKVKLEDVVINENNHYDMNHIEVLARDIQDHGQMANGCGYEIKVTEDGRERTKYKLLDGERRYRAIQLLNDEGILDPETNERFLYNLKIVDKPKSLLEEELYIFSGNMQRNKSKEERKREALLLSQNYDAIKQKNSDIDQTLFGEEFEVEPGEYRRDYIARLMHISSRQVQDLLTEAKKETAMEEQGYSVDEIEYAMTEEEEQKKNPFGLTSADKENLKMIAQNMSDYLDRKVTINHKYGISIAALKPGVDTEGDFYSILNSLGFDAEGNKENS